MTLLIDLQESSLFLRHRLGTIVGVQRSGVIFCLVSAVAFGAMGIFGKLAYDEGSTVGTLLSVRFTVAAVLLWILTVCTGALPRLPAMRRRDVAGAFALGAIGYGAQAGAYFAALDRLDASLLSLLVYTYPLIVTVAAIALGRDRANRRTAVALALASIGLVLVLAGAAAGALDPVGTALGLAAALTYSTYILVSTGLSERAGPLALSTLVCTGAACSLTLGACISGDLDLGAVSVAGFASLGGLALVSTVTGICLFFAGLRRVGPSAASILSTLEPVVAVALACAVFGESLGPAQLAGGALILLAVLVVRAPQRRRRAARAVAPVIHAQA